VFVANLKKATRESKEANVQQLMDGVENMEDYRFVQGSIHTLEAIDIRIDDILKTMRKQLTGDDDEED